jgi:hypothetical protein
MKAKEIIEIAWRERIRDSNIEKKIQDTLDVELVAVFDDHGRVEYLPAWLAALHKENAPEPDEMIVQ